MVTVLYIKNDRGRRILSTSPAPYRATGDSVARPAAARDRSCFFTAYRSKTEKVVALNNFFVARLRAIWYNTKNITHMLRVVVP